MGALIMAHSDDEGLVLPPKLAPIQVVIIPIPTAVADKLMEELKAAGISVKYDNDTRKRPGFKFAEYEMKGVPVRIGIGKRDLEKGVVEVRMSRNCSTRFKIIFLKKPSISVRQIRLR